MASQDKTGSVNRNPDATIQAGGEFHSKVERDEPLQTGGHKPGILVGNDAAPEFSAQTLPAGTAPKESTFQPNPTDTAPPTQQYRSGDQVEADAPQASATDFPGATSGDVHGGLGHPGQGQSSKELREKGTTAGGGHDGLVSGAQGKTVDPHNPQFANQRALDKDEAVTGKSTGLGGPPAQEREPETAESVASGRS